MQILVCIAGVQNAILLVLIFIMTEQTLSLGRPNSTKYKTIAKYKYMWLHWLCKVTAIAGIRRNWLSSWHADTEEPSKTKRSHERSYWQDKHQGFPLIWAPLSPSVSKKTLQTPQPPPPTGGHIKLSEARAVGTSLAHTHAHTHACPNTHKNRYSNTEPEGSEVVMSIT